MLYPFPRPFSASRPPWQGRAWPTASRSGAWAPPWRLHPRNEVPVSEKLVSFENRWLSFLGCDVCPCGWGSKQTMKQERAHSPFTLGAVWLWGWHKAIALQNSCEDPPPVRQRFSTFLTLPALNSVPCGVVTPNHKIISLLLHNYNFAIGMNHNVFSNGLRQPLWKRQWTPKGVMTHTGWETWP